MPRVEKVKRMSTLYIVQYWLRSKLKMMSEHVLVVEVNITLDGEGVEGGPTYS